MPFGVAPDGQGGGYVAFDRFDVVTQEFTSNHVTVDPVNGRSAFRSIPFRYVWPAELDLMARLAGLERTARWGDWTRGRFTADSTKHVSVWTKLR